ncbi:2-octaprenyl-3-methyl-6-methoxy-1,4-benzoquinol hydroxylase [Vibrio sp. 99-8-1]|uniref:2-octaprenyl-3-methyl-6-methoxy-1,4-benzoquinol hydroxylase n=1 Tax=Vibrio sp. 99-8-1 TaxID=2607602 RepID=UPI001493C89E|nr:2-octaprenyl-3-methyl-6-methoxy-1,4-benzoquinol hydroxylase [Vibrio sp. 99-8-1]NOI64957.1 2-octaprenyl-3-methyl-6-methoxy-1,4-benzoquinol hydroxylase [Vibrio sp. 99-8-1]
MQKESFDIVVIGGGMVGAATAVGLAQQGKRVALVEGITPQPFSVDQAMDIRVSAISMASVQLLESLGAWGHIKQMRTCPYRRLETWESPQCRTRFSADSLNMEQLGFIVENRLIQLGLWQQFSQYDNLHCFCPDSLSSIEFGEDTHRLVLESGQELQTHLVIGADGANSNVRTSAGIGITAWDYRQDCMLVNIETDKPQQDITWQWFTPSGPRSFLPLTGQQGSLVWYDKPQRIRQLVAMSNEALRDEIIAHFPEELGDIKVLQSGSFPLTRRHAQQYQKNRCVLVGDSAHTINPLAGQGVNLGFKDVSALLDVLKEREWYLESNLAKYERRRRTDNLLMQSGMDFFYKTFSNNIVPVKFARNAVLKFAEHAGPIKAQILKYAIGLS